MNKKQGVLLVNLGTPKSATKKGVYCFLRDFLSDKRVIALPRIIWLPLLYCIILPFRVSKVATLYKKIWYKSGSPLRFYTERQTQKLSAVLQRENIDVQYAMTYGQPSIAKRLAEFTQQGITDLTVIPLFPQYSVSTTAAVFDQLSAAINKQFNFPGINFIHDYHDHPLYIHALAYSIKQFWQENGRSECLIFSFHGIPKRYVSMGDVYQLHCERTVELLAEKLGLTATQYKLCYQSRVGRAEWLTPYLDQSLVEMAQAGIHSLDIISPAFSCDCLETLQELAIENKALFLENGGKRYHYIPCLNDRVQHIELLSELIRPTN